MAETTSREVRNCVVLLLKAADTGRYHPAIMTYAPMPSDDGTGPKRYRSRAHHTLGMESLEDARAMCANLAGQRSADDTSAEIVVYDTIAASDFHFTMMMPRQWPC